MSITECGSKTQKAEGTTRSTRNRQVKLHIWLSEVLAENLTWDVAPGPPGIQTGTKGRYRALPCPQLAGHQVVAASVPFSPQASFLGSSREHC